MDQISQYVGAMCHSFSNLKNSTAVFFRTGPFNSEFSSEKLIDFAKSIHNQLLFYHICPEEHSYLICFGSKVSNLSEFTLKIISFCTQQRIKITPYFCNEKANVIFDKLNSFYNKEPQTESKNITNEDDEDDEILLPPRDDDEVAIPDNDEEALPDNDEEAIPVNDEEGIPINEEPEQEQVLQEDIAQKWRQLAEIQVPWDERIEYSFVTNNKYSIFPKRRAILPTNYGRFKPQEALRNFGLRPVLEQRYNEIIRIQSIFD